MNETPTRHYHGRLWIPMPRGRLSYITGLTDKQARTALEHLKKAGIVETCSHIWRQKDGKPSMHIRLLWEAEVETRYQFPRLGANIKAAWDAQEDVALWGYAPVLKAEREALLDEERAALDEKQATRAAA